MTTPSTAGGSEMPGPFGQGNNSDNVLTVYSSMVDIEAVGNPFDTIPEEVRASVFEPYVLYPMDSFVYVARQKIETRHRQRSYLTALKTALEDACKWARISGCKKAFRATVGLNKAKNEPAIILKFRPTDARGKGGEAKRRMSKRTKMWVANRILRIMARCYGERAQPALAMSFPPRLWFMDQKKTLFLYTDDYPWRDKEFNEWQNRLIVDEIRGEMGSATEGRTP